MNAYGLRARSHLERHCPEALAAITDPDTHFTELGEQIAEEVEELEVALAGPAPPGETFMERVGRLNMARLMAEERVMADLVYSTSEGNEDELSDGATETVPGPGGPTTWEPLLPPDPDPEE